jgi:hypothetical protein
VYDLREVGLAKQVLRNYINANTSSFGTKSFSANEIDSGGCFHPTVKGQNIVVDTVWMTNTGLYN